MTPRFDPQEFATLARQLASTELPPVDGVTASTEARVRTALGRAYYTLFLAVRALISSRYGIHIRRLDHGILYQALQSSRAEAKLRHIGRELERLYHLRRKADYVLEADDADYRRLSDPAVAHLAAQQASAYVSELEALDYSTILDRF